MNNLLNTNRNEENLKTLFMFVFPIIAEQTLEITISVVDTIMVANIGETAVSAVSLVNSFNNLLIYTITAFASGGAVVISQYIGNQEETRAKECAGQLVTLLCASITLLSICGVMWRREFLNLLYGNTDREILELAVIYFHLICCSYPFIAIYTGASASLRASGNNKAALRISFCTNLINIVGNYILIYIFHLSVFGAALATLISRIIGAIAILVYTARGKSALKIDGYHYYFLSRDMVSRILSQGIPGGINNAITQMGKMLTTVFISTMGIASISANAAAISVTSIANIPGNSIRMAMIALVGQKMGRRDIQGVKKITSSLMRMAYAGNAIMNICIFLFADVIVSLYGYSDRAGSLAITLIRSFNFLSVFIWPLAFTLPGALQAVGDAKFTMMASTASMWLFRIYMCYFLGIQKGLGVIGIWLGMYLEWFILSTLYVLRFIKGRWKNIHVI